MYRSRHAHSSVKYTLAGLEVATVDDTDNGRSTKGETCSNRLLVFNFLNQNRSLAKTAHATCQMSAFSSRYCDNKDEAWFISPSCIGAPRPTEIVRYQSTFRRQWGQISCLFPILSILTDSLHKRLAPLVRRKREAAGTATKGTGLLHSSLF